MGKDLKGRELGVGICQRKDGLYTARFVGKHTGKTIQKYFSNLPECRKWYAETKFEDEHNGISDFGNMTVNAWFDYWINNIKGDAIRCRTIGCYRNQYNIVKEAIGNMILSDVKPMHCQTALNQMKDNYKSSTIKNVRTLLHSVFNGALENEVILKNPITKSVKYNFGQKSKEPRVLSIDEQRLLLEISVNYSFYNQIALVLQTGLRIAELVGLKWSDINFENNIMKVQRNLYYFSGNWIIGEPKTKSGYREIPLTEEAISILKKQKEKSKMLKIIDMKYAEFIFLTSKGRPVSDISYDQFLLKMSKKLDVEKFSMHTLRHTFATRCIEAGMKPKILQKILGHSALNLTMDLYVHATEDEKIKEIKEVGKYLKIV